VKKLYVAYFFKNKVDFGISNAIIEYKKISQLKDIAKIESAIANFYNMEEVKIISWQNI
jgi:hypothetical protein